MRSFDYLVVGQGLAGSVLAYSLLKAGQKVVILDNNPVVSASKIAAGTINPVTGRRLVKSWRIDEFLLVAAEFYTELEVFLGVRLWHERCVYKILKNAEEENQWSYRANFESYRAYMEPEILSEQDLHVAENLTKTGFLKPFQFAKTLKAAQVNIPLLVSEMRKYFLEKAILWQEEFDFSKIHLETGACGYKDYSFKKILFAEGAQAVRNPFFNFLPFQPDKGEMLCVKIHDFSFKNILKNNIAIVPLHDTQNGAPFNFWVGATNDTQFSDISPSPQNKTLILNELAHIFSGKFEVINHQAAVRPTVAERRPFLGLHADFPQLGIFNGLGTKGALLAPYWAQHLAAHLLENKPLELEADIRRFNKKKTAQTP
jgi:glycine oxidase